MQRSETGADVERALVDAAVNGDAEAFAALYDLHLRRVYRYVYYWVRNRADAEDLTQQVFMHAWRALSRYRQTEVPFVAWLVTIAHNLVVSFHRRLKTRPWPDRDLLSETNHHDPEVDTLSHFDRLAVREAILRLKPEQQHVITMRFLEQLDYATIAATLGKSEGNIRVIQHRALAALRRLLADEVTD